MSVDLKNDLKTSFLLLKNIEKLIAKLTMEQYQKLLNGEGEIYYRDQKSEVSLKKTRKAAVPKKEYDQEILKDYIEQIRKMQELAEFKKFAAKNKFDKNILLAIANLAGVKCLGKDTKERLIEKIHFDLVSFGANWQAMVKGVQE